MTEQLPLRDNNADEAVEADEGTRVGTDRLEQVVAVTEKATEELSVQPTVAVKYRNDRRHA